MGDAGGLVFLYDRAHTGEVSGSCTAVIDKSLAELR